MVAAHPADKGVMPADATPAPDAGSVSMTRDGAAMITHVGDNMIDVLGWRPDQLVGRPSTDFIHHDDQPGAISAWFNMIRSPGMTRVWRGRYQGADGTWKWVESVNVNR